MTVGQAITTPQRKPRLLLAILIGLPVLAVLMSTGGLILAGSTGTDLVRDDYYKAGVTIAADQRAEGRARASPLRAELRVGGRTVRLTVVQAEDLGAATPSLELLHPTRADQDRRIALIAAAGQPGALHWRGSLPSDLPHARWTVRLQNHDRTLRWHANAALPGTVQFGAAPP